MMGMLLSRFDSTGSVGSVELLMKIGPRSEYGHGHVISTETPQSRTLRSSNSCREGANNDDGHCAQPTARFHPGP